MKPCTRGPVLCALILPLLLLPVGAGAVLTVDTVEAGRSLQVASPRAIALDSAGNPHIAYGGSQLYHAYRDAGGWHVETVDPTPGAGSRASIAIDTGENAHTVWDDWVDEYKDHGAGMPWIQCGYWTRYTTNAGGAWRTETLPVCLMGMPRMAVDAGGALHLVGWKSVWPKEVVYATNAGGTWSEETLNIGTPQDIAVDANGKLHVIYSDWPNLMYATNAGGSWTTETIGGVWNGGRYVALAVTPDGGVHVAYSDGGSVDNHGINYATRSPDGTWVVDQVVDTGVGDGIEGVAIGVDGSGTVFIAYNDTTAGTLRRARGGPGAWTVETVTAAGDPPSLAVAPSGGSHLAYYDPATKSVAYAASTGEESWNLATVDTGGRSLGTSTAVAVGGGMVHMVYNDRDNDRLRYAVGSYGTWSVETVDAEAFMRSPCIVVGDDNAVRLVYEEFETKEIRFASNVSGSWQVETVMPSGRRLACIFQDDGTVHLATQKVQGGPLFYGTNASGEWRIEEISGLSGSPALALGPAGTLHVVAAENSYDPGNQTSSAELWYASRSAEGAWTEPEFVSSGWYFGTPWIGVQAGEGGGSPVLQVVFNAYVDTGELVCATRNADGTWTTETVVSGDVRFDPKLAHATPDGGVAVPGIRWSEAGEEVVFIQRSEGSWSEPAVVDTTPYEYGKIHMALDASGAAHLSYVDAFADIRYATNASGTWVSRSVENTIAYSWNDIAVDADGRAHIAYREVGTKSMKYATTAPVVEAGYDGNGDGLPDEGQENVASCPTWDGADVLTLEAPEGTTVESVEPVDNPAPVNTPEGVEFPYGFLKFTIGGLEPGGAATVTLYYPAGAAPSTYYQYGPTPDDPNAHWYEFLYDGTTGAEILGDTVLVHFVDGARGDHDLTADGKIVDPSAAGFGAPAVPGDLDGDGDVDRGDLRILLGDRRKTVDESACGPACDLDGDGRITVLDARKLVLLCTRPRCAVE